MAEPTVAIFGPIDAVLAPGNRTEFVILVLVLASFVTRKLAHDRHRRQAASDDATLTRYTPHTVTVGLLVLASFYFTTLDQHAGIVFTMFVLGMFFADIFEFEARQVEAREGIPLERPNGAIAASVLVLLYAAFLSLFFIVAPFWNQIV